MLGDMSLFQKMLHTPALAKALRACNTSFFSSFIHILSKLQTRHYLDLDFPPHIACDLTTLNHAGTAQEGQTSRLHLAGVLRVHLPSLQYYPLKFAAKSHAIQNHNQSEVSKGKVFKMNLLNFRIVI